MRYGPNIYAVNKVTKMNRPATLAEVAERVSAGDAFDRTLSEFLDEFYGHPARRQAMIEVSPPVLADARQHATLGGVAEHLARRWVSKYHVGRMTHLVSCMNRILRRRSRI
jgi:hypothetical protein